MARTDARVLLADDMKTVLMVEDGLLRSLGFKPFLAPSGGEALKALCENDIELAFLDYYMPDMNGPDVIRLFRDTGSEKKTVFIAVTSEERKAREVFLDEGFDEVLIKPLEAGKLLEIIKRYIPKDR